MAQPGRTAIQGAISMYCRASLSMRPHDGVGGWVPRPRKLSAASVRIAVDSDTVVCTSSGAEMLGTTWRSMMAGVETPTARAASMYGSCATVKVGPRATLANVGAYTIPI